MSRTDKDTPHHVHAEVWEAWHHPRCSRNPLRTRIGSMTGGRKNPYLCDLPDNRPRLAVYLASKPTGCTWQPRCRCSPTSPPPRWFKKHVWHSPERLAARVECLDARKEHRAHGDVDTDPTTRQHRHGARWLWS